MRMTLRGLTKSAHCAHCDYAIASYIFRVPRRIRLVPASCSRSTRVLLRLRQLQFVRGSKVSLHANVLYDINEILQLLDLWQFVVL